MKRNMKKAASAAGLLAVALAMPGLSQSARVYAGIMAASEEGGGLDSGAAFQSWLENEWSGAGSDSGEIALTPGSTESDLNFAWYSKTLGTPAVMVWKDDDSCRAMSIIVAGTAEAVSAENLQGESYSAANKVSITGYFEENSKYHYCYTDDIESGVWSEVYDYQTADSADFTVILTGDPQIGASFGGEDALSLDGSIAQDTYNWNLTVTAAAAQNPNAAFLLSTGDQIDQLGNMEADDSQRIRESEYAGYLYPDIFRSLPIAAAIGNHDAQGADYSGHFNNPNTDSALGATEAGCDYYFSYGDVLFIIINSNNRSEDEHRALLAEAVASNPDAVWRVAVFHSDIYGAGWHSEKDAAADREIFAPLMDAFDIDVAFNGHDHIYARSYQLFGGGVIEYGGGSTVIDPVGTLYVSTGTASGSKYNRILDEQPYYIAEAGTEYVPTYSVVRFTENTVSIRTYDYNGNQYAQDYMIIKTEESAAASALGEAEQTGAAVRTVWAAAACFGTICYFCCFGWRKRCY